ncbi:CDK-activating kinase assembly factor MAT1 [Cocos nucifera]|uniref:CDK-activating kinase assembly factor MAT1 n=1 Tax=Cocos nucifera TaxID=13894 RepID=A0A8K0I2K5_COCNU|nr:CDK-activating kinase assembly factor MAT1 [Cocos nucifera]
MVVASGSNSNSWTKEMPIRRRIANIYNKREEDFPSLREYNDYLEEVEDMTYNLVEGIDVAAIEAKIAKYQEENAEQIINARARKAEELAAALRANRGNSIQADPTDVGAGPSSQGVGMQGQYAPAAVPGAGLAQPRPTGMAPQPIPIGGPIDPLQGYAAEDEEAKKIREERGARAGGWTIELSKRRAIEEAFSSIWI